MLSGAVLNIYPPNLNVVLQKVLCTIYVKRSSKDVNFDYICTDLIINIFK